jgi:uncharacterized protein (TIGR04255 family)
MDALKLKNPPIVEAVVDINCDMPPTFNVEALPEKALELFRPEYPQVKKQYVEQYEFKPQPGAPPDYSLKRGVSGLQFMQSDGKQVIQVRTGGYSFNRLAPYGSLDEYLVEIKRTWEIFVSLTRPNSIRSIQLRYINRIMLPLGPTGVTLSDYFKITSYPDIGNLVMTGFLHQISSVDSATNNTATVILTGLPPEKGQAPILLDISVAWQGSLPVEDVGILVAKIQSLRALKNSVFSNTLTPQCLNLYQPL